MYSQSEVKDGVSILNWMGTLVVLSIPVVNLIMLIVWAVASKRRSKRNFCIAALILIVLAIIASVVAVALAGPQIVDFFASLNTKTLTGILTAE